VLFPLSASASHAAHGGLQGVPLRVGLVPYFGLEGAGTVSIDNLVDEEEGFAGEVRLSGSTNELGEYRVRIQPGKPPLCSF
jgi:hypothetical protein